MESSNIYKKKDNSKTTEEELINPDIFLDLHTYKSHFPKGEDVIDLTKDKVNQFELNSDLNIILDSVAPNPYDISYTCLIIPRFRSHYLIGDLAESLHGWMHQISIAFGWRIELLIIRPEYLQWGLTVSPVTSPARLISIIQEQTSRRILEEYPRTRKDNPSNDFWALGYVAIPGIQPIYPEMVNMFIQQIRQKQGYRSNSE